MRLFLTIIFVFTGLSCFAQSKKTKPRDQIWLKSGETETGRIISSDSSSLILKKYDHSRKTILWNNIDTITGLSYKTFFASPFVGVGDINYFSTFRYDKINASGMLFGIRAGMMKRKRMSTYLQLIEMPVKPYNVFKTGVGFNYHVLKDYTQKLTAYAGARFEMTNVQTNSKPFFNYVLQWGAEYNTKNGNRFFTELSYQKTIFNVHNGTGVHFTLGIRFSKEYRQFYKRLNTLRKL